MKPRPLPPTADLAALALLAVGPLLPPVFGAPAAALALLVWARRPAGPREQRIGLVLFAAAVTLLVFAALADRAGSPRLPGTEELARGHRAWLTRLDRETAAAATRLEGFAGVTGSGALQRRLAELAAASPGRTLLLLDADDQPAAWSGEGFLHELVPASLPAAGRTFRQSATSATPLSVVPLGRPAGWRLIAGQSLARDAAPPVEPRTLRERLQGGWHLESSAAGPELSIGTSPGDGARRGVPWARLAAAVTAFALLWVAALRAAGRALLAGTVVPRRQPVIGVLLPAALAIVLALRAAGASDRSLALLAGALGATLLGVEAGRRLRGRGWAPLAATAVPVLLVLTARLSADPLAPLGAAAWLDGDALALRLALVLAVFAPLAAASGGAVGRQGERWGWLAAALALLGAALAGWPVAACLALAAGGAAAARLLAGFRLGLSLATASGVLIAALLGGAAWTLGEQLAVERDLPREAAALLPPDAAERGALARGIEDGLTRLDLARWLPPGAPMDERGDLAFALWRASPLARLDLLSALVVDFEDGGSSTFSFGLPLDRDGNLVETPERWADLETASWPQFQQSGSFAPLEPAGEVRGLRWWAVPRLGFGAGRSWSPDLAAGLLRGVARGARPFGLAPQVRYLLRSSEGRLVSSSWEEGTPSPAAVEAAPGRSSTVTPDGTARTAVRHGEGATAAVFLPRLGAGAALEQAGSLSAGGLLALLFLLALGWILALPRSAVRDLLRRATRSYSKRLLIAFAALLLVPVGVFYFFLSQALERRVVSEQEASARSALRSAQRVLGEYVLTLQPGFGVGTAIDDALLEWLSRVVRHEIHLYWGSEVYASSKRDLFAAGLLPRRLPGEVRERLGTAGDGLARRISRIGDATYLELYAPLEVPGEARAGEADEARLVLSMPLLAQQEEALAEVERLRRQALLASLALLVALAATGTRAARRFSRPIEELVAGTRRIAAGATELGVRPGDAELEALSEAIDRMAQGIAAGRDRLLAEKRLVERIVEAVTGAVVALDVAGRVLIINRAGRELLSAEPGDRLVDRLVDRADLAPVAAFAGEPSGPAARAVLRLGTDSGDEREWTLVRVPLTDAGDAAALLVVEDVTEVVRVRRLEAWAEMARIIAHEIKNPLTPIRLSAEHLREAWQRDRVHFAAVFERCTRNILAQVDELREIASEFSAYSQIPRIERQEGDLVAAVSGVAEAYRASPPAGVAVSLVVPPDALIASFDPRLLPRAVRNLIENAVRAVSGGGVVEVKLERRGDAAILTVRDDGPGVPSEQLGRILEPYFSTHATGTGLGLPIAARIAEEHGGGLEVRNRPGGGFEVVVTIPLR